MHRAVLNYSVSNTFHLLLSLISYLIDVARLVRRVKSTIKIRNEKRAMNKLMSVNLKTSIKLDNFTEKQITMGKWAWVAVT